MQNKTGANMELRILSHEEREMIHQEAVKFARRDSIIRQEWNSGHVNASRPSTTAGILKAAADLATMPIFRDR
jgi:hypothetical protein